MLARLQQATTLSLALIAIVWASWAWSIGHGVLGLCGALSLMFAYAGVLAAEFALLRRAHGEEDPTPRASTEDLLTAWWGELASAPLVFCWRQPFRSRHFADHLPDSAFGRRALLLVHGFVCNRGLWNRWLQRLQEANIPFVAVNLEPVFGSIDEYVAIIEDAMQRIEAATGLAPVLVGHSMGGLAIRRWWAERAEEGRVHHVVTIGTPHQGTWLARFAMSRNARQMQQNSSWLQKLAQREPPGRAARFTCFYSHCDNIVFPPMAATLEGADNRHLLGVAHVHMVDRSEPYEEAVRWLAFR
jgi:predicted alpha/beta hydrolase family esterase